MFVHGDLHGGNQVWSAAELQAVLDFENAGLGEAEYELRGFTGPGEFWVHDLGDRIGWLPDGYADLALCALTTEGVDDRGSALSELHRVPRPGWRAEARPWSGSSGLLCPSYRRVPY